MLKLNKLSMHVRPDRVRRGFTILEVLIALTVFSISAVFIAHSQTLFFEITDGMRKKIKMVYLAEGGLEMLGHLRSESWSTINNDLTVDTTYYFDISTSTLATTTVAESIEGNYNRSFILRDLYRDSNFDIVASTTGGASIDRDGRIAEVTVTHVGDSVTLSSFLININDE